MTLRLDGDRLGIGFGVYRSEERFAACPHRVEGALRIVIGIRERGGDVLSDGLCVRVSVPFVLSGEPSRRRTKYTASHTECQVRGHARL